MALSLRPRFVHDTSNVLGSIRTDGCSPLDLLRSMYAAQCSDCSCVATMRGVQVGLPFERRCSTCHKVMALQLPSVGFIPLKPTGGGRGNGGGGGSGGPATRLAGVGGRQGAGRQLPQSNTVLQVGQPLPARGTCKHYKHSYRWLRFPCCGMRFPCDLCHEECADNDHEMKWATRMVCGYCSLEQRVAVECKACGKKLATTARNPSGRNTRFWEGGAGCRDAARMNKNDAHKFRGSKHKTSSAKHKRVGQKAGGRGTARRRQSGSDN